LQAWLRSLLEDEPEELDIRGEHAKQEPIARRMLREKEGRRAKHEGGAAQRIRLRYRIPGGSSCYVMKHLSIIEMAVALAEILKPHFC
jgi:hypothetical protein